MQLKRLAPLDTATAGRCKPCGGGCGRLHYDGGLKAPFRMLVHNGLSTAVPVAANHLHVRRSSSQRSALLGLWWPAPSRPAAVFPRPAIWLCRATPCIHAGVWDLVCLAAVAAVGITCCVR